jgi:hypothetical protein
MKKWLEFINSWWTLITRPIYFFVKMPAGDWKEESFTFMAWSVWTLAFALTVMVFVSKYLLIGAYIVDKISGVKALIISPVIAVLGIVFFIITLGVVAGLLQLISVAGCYCLGWAFHFLAKKFGGAGTLEGAIKVANYSSGVMLFFTLVAGFVLLNYFGIFTAELFRTGVSLVLYFTLFYVYGIWAIGLKISQKLTRSQAFMVAGIIGLVLLLAAIVFDVKFMNSLVGKLI